MAYSVRKGKSDETIWTYLVKLERWEEFERR
jgi:hypothetical protein